MRTQRTLESLLTIPIVYFVFLRWIVFSTSISGPEHGTPKNGTTNEMRRNRRGPRRLACVCVRKVLIHVVFKVAVRWKITCTLYPLSKRPLARAHTHKPTADSLSMNEHLVYLLTYSHYDARNDYFIISFAASPRILRMFFFSFEAFAANESYAFLIGRIRTIHRVHRKMQFSFESKSLPTPTSIERM